MRHLLLLIFLCIPIFAQDYHFKTENINSLQGLSQLSVKKIIQDYQGFIWFATDDGINRFDGFKCKVYQYNPSDPLSLKNNLITDICEDINKNLWVSTQLGGLHKYNRENDRFEYVNLNLNTDEDSEMSIYSLYIFGEYLWIGTRDKGVIKFNINTYKAELITINEGLNTNNITVITGDLNGNIWIGTSNSGFNKLSLSDNYNKVEHYASGLIFSADTDNFGNIWFANNNEIKKLNSINNEIITYKIENINISQKSNILPFISTGKNKNNIILTYSDKLFRYDLNEDNFFPLSFEDENLINNSILRTVYTEDDKLIWLGSINNGAFKIDLSPSIFQSFLDENHIGLKIPGTSIVQDSEGFIWAGTFGSGLFQLDSNKIIINNLTEEKIKNVTHIFTILNDVEDNIWFGTIFNGLFKYNKNSNLIINYNSSNSSLKSRGVSYLYQDKQNDIWAGTFAAGLFKYDKIKNDFIDVSLDSINGFKISDKGLYSIFNDSRGFLWIGTESKGLDRINLTTGELKNFSHNSEIKYSLSHNFITSIYEDSKGNLWIGTYSGGLNKFDYETETFKYYTVKEGLSNNSILSITEDNYENLWISSNAGISKINLKTETISVFTNSDGLPSNEFAISAICNTKSGEIILGSLEGFTFFNPLDINETKVDYKIVLTDFLIDNKEAIIGDNQALKKSIITANEINLSYKNKLIEFEFVALNYDIQKSLKYAYKMEGFDKDWNITTPDRRFATYTNLNPGTYKFKVKAIDRSGKFSEQEASVLINITSPYWNTWWFYLLILVSIVLILYLIYKIRINKLREIEELRLKIASDLHDEVGSTLTKVSMRAEMLEMQINGGEEEIKSLKRISEQTREAVSVMHDIVWTIDSRFDKVEDLIEKMKDFVFSSVNEKNIKVNFDVVGLELTDKLEMNTRQNLFLILKESVNNILKHSNATEVNILLKNSPEKFEMIINDNGNNYLNKEYNSGQGLKNIEMRANKINGKAEFNFENGFTVNIKSTPIK